MSKQIKEAKFAEILKKGLGSSYPRALTIFQNYGQALAFDVTNVLLYASEQNKIEEVLNILEKHWQEHLQYQHPEARGQISKGGVNPTELMFLQICEKTLGLKPNKK
ncbi:MAG: hypothetical protein A2Y67_02405 [Candidatus Buchananbacteria bacterium RBG_13_39_9]|uniref:Uncharacterized protein n=1 Tax=Candidatus Buchananbacteria bacterium RBG_13_39_9 TaxID=1797531 RepID=A0A1G1XPP0_9BACT|nr:MAG: hypothetical protein A2Y67_02405 [Candidatus Buchananbacteria bacterium RBG_13_39_9]